MPRRDLAPLGAPTWIDLMTSDVAKSRAFYQSLLGWTSEDPGEEYGGYINFLKDGVPVAGCMANPPDSGMPNGWSVYLATEDAVATAALAAAHGGQVLMPAMDVMDLGAMAVLADAGGAMIGVWQPKLHKGFGVLAEAGAPVWFELHAQNYDASVRFYQDVFGWDTHVMSDVPTFRYTTLGEGDGALAGIMDAADFLPEGAPARWAVYFGVADTDAAVTQLVDLGGSVLRPAEDTPFGRIAEVADPTGAMFRLNSVS